MGVIKTADKKPEIYTKPDGKRGVRMVPTDKQIVKTESAMNMRNAKLINKIKKSGVAKQGSMKDEDQVYDKKAVAKKGYDEVDELSMSLKDLTKSGVNKKGHGDKDKLKKDLAKLKKGLGEEVELDEGSMASAAKELEAYARKSGGIDKGDFLKAVVMMKKGMKPQLNKFVDDLDTEPREKILHIMKKHLGEEVEHLEEGPFKGVGKQIMRAKVAGKRFGTHLKKMRALDKETSHSNKHGDYKDSPTYQKKAKELDKAYWKLSKKQNKLGNVQDRLGKKPGERDYDKWDYKKDLNKRKLLNKEEVKLDEVLDRPGALDSYRKKADDSGNRARNSATRKILTAPKDGKRPDHSDELNTMRKRNKGQDMADRVAARQFRKSIGQPYIKKESVELDELSPRTKASYYKKASDQNKKVQKAYDKSVKSSPDAFFGDDSPKDQERMKTMTKRQKGMAMAKGRKYGQKYEEVEQIPEAYRPPTAAEIKKDKERERKAQRAAGNKRSSMTTKSINKNLYGKMMGGLKTEEYVNEKLNVSQGMGAWVDDFKKSDAPQFKGKSDKERRDMAIAAYLSAKRGQK